MMLIPRTFSQIGQEQDAARSKTLSFYFEKQALVVLGEPGAGKTTSFESASEEEENAVYVSVRDFLALSSKRWEGKTLYLDGLDEQRAKNREGAVVLDQLRTKLDELGQPRFRLSCRAADWYGNSDVDRLRLVSADKTISIVRIDPLTEEDIAIIASNRIVDADEFILEAKQRQVYELLTNPLTLNLILSVVAEGEWPNTKSELFQQASLLLLVEYNDEHSRITDSNISDDDLLEAAGHLCSVQLCAGVAGFALSRKYTDSRYPSIHSISKTKQSSLLAIKRRIFKSIGSERVEPIHRSIAEFLAAKYLVSSIRNGLPLGRVLSILTGYDGGTLSDLRGLYAWVTTLCHEHADQLIPRDPLGIVLYGDVANLTSSQKKIILESLSTLAQKNPWFRSENWAEQPFGNLASPDMEQAFRTILQNPSQHHSVLLRCILNAIAYGKSLPNLADLLIKIIHDDNLPISVREDALDAFKNAHPNPTLTLVSLLNEINSDVIKDEDCRIRGELLWELYPTSITPDQVLQYLVNIESNYYGKYFRFLDHRLVEATPLHELQPLLDQFADKFISLKSAPRHSAPSHHWQRFAGQLLVSGIKENGEKISIQKLYRWLGISLDEYGRRFTKNEHGEAIREWLSKRPTKIKALFQYWVSSTSPQKLWHELHFFQERVQFADRYDGYPQFLLDWASTENDKHIADFLFRVVVRLRTQLDRPDAQRLDDFLQYVHKHIQFQSALESEFYCEISDWQIEHAEERQRHRQERKTALEGRIVWLLREIDSIKKGTSGALSFLAQLYFGHFIDVDHDLHPYKRLVVETSTEIADAALQGFMATLRRKDLPAPEQIGELYLKSGKYTICDVVLAGMDVLESRSESEISKLPELTKKAALAFYYANATAEKNEWVKELIKLEPKLVGRVFQTFWAPQLDKRTQHIPGLYELAREESMQLIAKQIALPLLRRYPRCGVQSLDYLMTAVLRDENSINDLLSLVSKVLPSIRYMTELEKTHWLTTAFVLNPKEFHTRIARFIGKKVNRAINVLQIVYPSRKRVRLLDKALGPEYKAILIKLTGQLIKPSDSNPKNYKAGEASHVTELMEATEKLHAIIQDLSNDVSPSATDSLEALTKTASLFEWKEVLAHSAALQARRRREAQFRYPTAEDLVKALNYGPPVNPADLQAIVTDHLHTIGTELHHGSTDGYKALWNVSVRKKPTIPRPEDDCRDRILERLKHVLYKISVSVEREGVYARDKRADIKIIYGSINLPVEIKKHYHRDLWTAPIKQLKKLYSRDPGTGGRGIYLVLWFGLDFKSIPKPPNGVKSPTRSIELKETLNNLLPLEDRTLLEIIVFDVSRG